MDIAVRLSDSSTVSSSVAPAGTLSSRTDASRTVFCFLSALRRGAASIEMLSCFGDATDGRCGSPSPPSDGGDAGGETPPIFARSHRPPGRDLWSFGVSACHVVSVTRWSSSTTRPTRRNFYFVTKSKKKMMRLILLQLIMGIVQVVL